MAAVSNAAAAAAPSASLVVKQDIEEHVKKLIAVADNKFKLSHADIDKTYADKEYTELKGRAKIYICKCDGNPAALIPILFKDNRAYLLMTIAPCRELPYYFIYRGSDVQPVQGNVARIFKGELTNVQIQLEGKS